GMATSGNRTSIRTEGITARVSPKPTILSGDLRITRTAMPSPRPPVRHSASSPILRSANSASTAPGKASMPASEAAVEAHPADGLTGTAADSIGGRADEGVAGRGLGRLLGGVVPIDPVTGRPGLRANLGEIEHANERCLDGGTAERRARGDAEDGADEEPVP